MPSAAKTSVVRIVAAARKIISRRGAEALSMQAVASAVGVRAPSLYKHFPDRSAIVQAVRQGVIEAWVGLQARAATHSSARENLRAIARTHRSFAMESPHLYALIFDADAATQLTRADSERAVEPLRALCSQVAAPADALLLARALTSFAHGFVVMQLSGAFHLDGDLDRAFEFGLERLLGGATR